MSTMFAPRAAFVSALVLALTSAPPGGADPYPWADQKLPPLVLEKHGIFWAGGQVVQRTQPGVEDNEVSVGQAYVEYFIPHRKRNNAIPIVMTHSSSSGAWFLTTPDGREGWADFFVRRGFPVYIVDPAGTGRAGFSVDAFNRVRLGVDPPSSQPNLNQDDSSAWERRNNGPEPQVLGEVDPTCIGNDGRGSPPLTCYGWRIANDDESYKHYLAMGIPRGPRPVGETNSAFIALLEEIGPVIWLGWSAGGSLGGELVGTYPEFFEGLIGVEPSNNCLYDPGIQSPGAIETPALSIHGINQIGRPSEPAAGRLSRADCEAIYESINSSGGDATWLSLYDIGIFGNSHAMFWEDNSDEIAQVLLDWIDEHVEKPKGRRARASRG